MEGFEPKHRHQPTKEERYRALECLMYLKEKRGRKIRDRGYANGRSQQLYTSKIETSSTTASLAAIMLTYMIDAFEKRNIATVNIPGAFFYRPRFQKTRTTFSLSLMKEWLNCWQKLHQRLTKNMFTKDVVKHTYIAV